MNNLNLFLLLLIPLLTSGQDCYDYFEDALYLSKFDEHKSLSDSILDLEISNNSKYFKVYLLKSKFQYEKGDKEGGLRNLYYAVKYGCNLRHHIFSNKFMKSHLTKMDSLELIEYAKKEVAYPFNASNKISLIKLLELVHWDQALSNFTLRYHDSMCINSSQSRAFELKITRNMLRKYLNDFGYPDEKDFGSELVDRFDLVIIHHFQKVDSCDWLKTYYDEAFDKGKISTQRYYNYYDKLLVYKDLPQKYGTFSGGKNINGSYQIYPIENISNIDNIRKKLCLSPFHVFLKNNGFDIPDNYRFDINEYLSSIRSRFH